MKKRIKKRGWKREFLDNIQAVAAILSISAAIVWYFLNQQKTIEYHSEQLIQVAEGIKDLKSDIDEANMFAAQRVCCTPHEKDS